MRRPCVLVFATVLTLGLAGCDDDGKSVLTLPDQTFDPVGEWTLELSYESDTCGRGEVALPDLEVEITGGGSVYSVLVEGKVCDAAVFTLEDNCFVVNFEPWVMEVGVNCAVRSSESLSLAMSSDASLHGSYVVLVEEYGGDCVEYGLPLLPCEFHYSVLGARCTGCFDGCVEETNSAEASVLATTDAVSARPGSR